MARYLSCVIVQLQKKLAFCIMSQMVSFASSHLRRVYTKQRACAQEIHRASLEALHNKSKSQSVDKVPAVETDVKLTLHLRVCKANLGEDSVEVV